MKFGILGPVEAVGADGAVPLGGPRQRALFAFLLMNANRAVSADTLVEELWATPPRDAHAALQNQVSRLRKVLGDRLVTKAPGYVLRVEEGELDLDRFRSLVAAAGATADPAERSRLLREADQLFRGTPFAEIDAPFAAAEAGALEELRSAAIEARVDADLERGRHSELVSELSALVARHPLRERLRGQHILALYRCGRQAEALEAYRATREALDEQLGLEPGPALRDLERAILRHDPTLAPTRTEDETEAAAAAPVAVRSRRRPVLLVAGAVALGLAGGGAALLLRQTPAKHVAAPPASHRHRVHPVHRVVAPTKPHVAATVKPKHHAVHVVAKRIKPRIVHERSVTVIKVEPTVATPAPPPVKHTTTAAVATTIAPKPQPKPKPKAPADATPTVTTQTVASPPSDWRELQDDFSGSTPNWAMWQTNYSGTGGSYAQQNGRLELTLDGGGTLGGQYDMLSAGLASVCHFDDDFDARVDYTLLQWPSDAGASVQLAAWTLPTSGVDVTRVSNQWNESYFGNLNGTWNGYPASGASGTLRVTRRKGVVASYYLDRNKWVQLITGTTNAEVTIGLSLLTDQQDWVHKTVRIAFDNFSIAAPSFSCH